MLTEPAGLATAPMLSDAYKKIARAWLKWLRDVGDPAASVRIAQSPNRGRAAAWTASGRPTRAHRYRHGCRDVL